MLKIKFINKKVVTYLFIVISIIALFKISIFNYNDNTNTQIIESPKTVFKRSKQYSTDDVIQSLNSSNLKSLADRDNTESIDSIVNKPTGNKRAYLLMLTSDSNDETDIYYIAISSIIYKFLYNPKTKTTIGGVDIIVMVTDVVADWKIRELHRLGAVIKRVKPIQLKGKNDPNDRWRNCYTKLYMFNMVEYETIVYLDADLLIKENIDDLFRIAEKTRKETGRKDFFGAVTDGAYGDITADKKGMINAGVMVITPEKAVYDDLLELSPKTQLYDVGFMEQGLLSYYYSDDNNKFDRVRTHLPTIYNAQWYTERLSNRINEVKVIHQKFWRTEKYRDRCHEVQQQLLEGILDWITYVQRIRILNKYSKKN